MVEPRPKSQQALAYESSPPIKTSPAGPRPEGVKGHVWIHEADNSESGWCWNLYKLAPEAQ